MLNSRLQKLLKYFEQDSGDSFIIFAIAKEYENLNDWESSLKYYRLLLEEHPDYIGTYYHLAQLYGEMEDTDNALDIYARGIQKAKEQNDQHALSELKNAKLNFELENGL